MAFNWSFLSFLVISSESCLYYLLYCLLDQKFFLIKLMGMIISRHHVLWFCRTGSESTVLDQIPDVGCRCLHFQLWVKEKKKVVVYWKVFLYVLLKQAVPGTVLLLMPPIKNSFDTICFQSRWQKQTFFPYLQAENTWFVKEQVYATFHSFSFRWQINCSWEMKWQTANWSLCFGLCKGHSDPTVRSAKCCKKWLMMHRTDVKETHNRKELSPIFNSTNSSRGFLGCPGSPCCRFSTQTRGERIQFAAGTGVKYSLLVGKIFRYSLRVLLQG